MKDNRWCLICKPKNRTIYFHKDSNTGKIWLWCNKCSRGYSIEEYCRQADIEIEDFLKGNFDIEDDQEGQVNAMTWPVNFVPLSDPRAQKGVDYILSRGLSLDGDMYYDLEEEGIVFPYYYDKYFCGAQIRFIKSRVRDNGDLWKITTLPGTKLGQLFGLWNQNKLMPHIKGIIVCEGYFNALALQQSFNFRYGSVSKNPWKVICTSGSGVSAHQSQTMRDLKKEGYTVIAAFDSDEAGLKGLKKLMDDECISHYALTNDTVKDWNDLLKDTDYTSLSRFFLKSVIKV